MNINEKLISINYNYGRYGQSVGDIVIHTNGGPAPTGLFNWFNSSQSQVSAHYQIYLSGQIDRYVRESDTAWHAGVWSENLVSIGIEHEDNGNAYDSVRTDAQYEASAQLIADIYRRYNFPFNDLGRIKPHYEFVPSRPCPAGLNINRIRDRVKELLNPQPVPTVDPKPPVPPVIIPPTPVIVPPEPVKPPVVVPPVIPPPEIPPVIQPPTQPNGSGLLYPVSVTGPNQIITDPIPPTQPNGSSLLYPISVTGPGQIQSDAVINPVSQNTPITFAQSDFKATAPLNNTSQASQVLPTNNVNNNKPKLTLYGIFKDFLQRFSSRKFLLVVTGLIVVIYNSKTGRTLDQNELNIMAFLIGIYNAIEGIKDINTNQSLSVNDLRNQINNIQNIKDTVTKL